ncbi:MAG: universal stress protein [Methyloligella sp. ZOD6]
MTIKRILVPAGGGKNFEVLLDTAFRLGEKFSAQVMGLFVQPADVFNITGMDAPLAFIETTQQIRRDAAASAESAFKAATKRFPHVDSVFRSVEGEIEASFIAHARLADMSVIMPPDPHEDGFWGSSFWFDVQNATLFRSGRPVLVVPPHAAKLNFDNVAIAWKDSLEASRAVSAAQPFMTPAREVHLLTIKEGEDDAASLQKVEEYMALHYDSVRSEILNGEPHQVGKLLLAKAYDLEALLIMGAYSHWRWRERLLGGATEYVLNEASIPVLMTH